jgi:beta-galactosidase
LSFLLGERLPHLAFGGDYNPEQWPEAVWPEDIRLMREAGVNLVTIGVFSWSRLEPTNGSYDFGWLDRILDRLHQGGIMVDLATATASPPPWLSHEHPETLPMLADGVRLWPGARQHYCPSSPVYRTAARHLVERLAERYARHPALAMWHIGNEYGCHVPACWCEESARDFRGWLQRRYRTIDDLNRAWGTDFWSQRYSTWEEILPPRRAPTWPNPSQQLDFFRFCSDALLACFEIERALLKERSPGVPITTNFMGFFKPLDYWTWAQREDIVSNDSYPDPADVDAAMRAAMAGDLMRSLGHGRPWLLMEQSPNRVNWRPVNLAKAPGQMRLWSYQALARGSDGVMFFQWRQSQAGAEKFHSAMVPHGPVATSPTWREVVRLGGELGRLDAVCGSRVRASVAIVFDWESWWALELPSKPSAELRLIDQLESYYRALYDANVTADFASPTDDLSGYRLVLVPNLYLVGDEAAGNLTGYVREGGRLVMSFFSGIVDPLDQVRLGGYPAPFREMLAIEVVDFLPLPPGATAMVRWTDGATSAGSVWTELVRADEASVIARFAAGVLEGQPAVTRHAYGKGNVHYLGTRLDPAAMAELLRRVWSEAGVTPVLNAAAGVEAVRREGRDGSILFLLNHTEESVEVNLALVGEDLIGGRGGLASGGVRLPPRDVAAIREPRDAAHG